jgi:hypothetical protein
MMATAKQWATAEWLRLLAKLPRRMDAKQLADLANRYQPAVPVAETLMDEGDWGQPIARRIYAKTRAGYHAVTQGSVDAVVTPAG